MSENYEALSQDRYRKSTTEVYDSYTSAAKAEKTIYDNFQTDDFLEQCLANVNIMGESSDQRLIYNIENCEIELYHVLLT